MLVRSISIVTLCNILVVIWYPVIAFNIVGYCFIFTRLYNLSTDAVAHGIENKRATSLGSNSAHAVLQSAAAILNNFVDRGSGQRQGNIV